jgi:hypothetical protein
MAGLIAATLVKSGQHQGKWKRSASSIPDAAMALTEMRRVLRPNGKLLFVEHGMAPDKNVRRWQDWLTPAWKRIGGGCHLNRPIRTMIESGGFRFDRVETGYMPGPKLMTFMYEGSARPG